MWLVGNLDPSFLPFYLRNTRFLNCSSQCQHYSAITLLGQAQAWLSVLTTLNLMIKFFGSNSRAFLPTFHTNCPDGSHLAQMGSHFAQNTIPNPCSLLSSHTPLSGIYTYTKRPQAHPKTPLWTNLDPKQFGPQVGKKF